MKKTLQLSHGDATSTVVDAKEMGLVFNPKTIKITINDNTHVFVDLIPPHSAGKYPRDKKYSQQMKKYNSVQYSTVTRRTFSISNSKAKQFNSNNINMYIFSTTGNSRLINHHFHYNLMANSGGQYSGSPYFLFAGTPYKFGTDSHSNIIRNLSVEENATCPKTIERFLLVHGNFTKL